MKNKKIILSSILALGVLGGVVGVANRPVGVEALNIATGTKLYLKPSAYWNQSNARFAAYFFGTGNTWVSMTDSDGDGIHEVVTPDGTWTNVIFCRMNPGNSSNSWDTKWNQTSDLTWDGTNNLYTVKENTWDKGGGTWSYLDDGSNTPEIDAYVLVEDMLKTAYNNGRYKRTTSIKLDKTNAAYDAEVYFHASVDMLDRTTYFDNNLLWMQEANSGYSTDNDGKMNHFTFENGIKSIDYTVQNSTGMEDWYVTLKDISESINENQGWEESTTSGVYKSSDKSLINLFGSFTAPCFLGFEGDSENLLTFDRVEVSKDANENVTMSLYVKSDSKGWVEDQTTLLFSQATISSIGTKVAVAGGFNDWNQYYDLIPTDKTGVYYTEMSLAETSYEMKVVINDAWHGNEGTYSKYGEAWDFWDNNGNNCKLSLSKTGIHSFTINTLESYPKLSINTINQ